MTTHEFINQLGKMPIAGYNDKKIIFESGLEITYAVKLAEWKGDLPLQMLVIVSYLGSYVMTYGAENEQDNADLAYMWRTLDRRAQEKVSDRKQDEARRGYTLLMQGID